MTTIHIRADGSGPDALAQVVAQHRAGFAAGADSDIMPFDASRFPLSAAFDDACAPEGAAPVTRYEDGIAELEGDPWIFWAVVAGVIGGALLSVAFPMGWAS
jgi:hypothetical protein